MKSIKHLIPMTGAVIFLFLSVPFKNITAKTIRVPADYPTIQQAVDSSSAGDTIFIDVGYYDNENIQIYHRLTIMGKHLDSVTVDGVINYPFFATLTILTDSVTIENLKIFAPIALAGGGDGFSAIRIDSSSLIIMKKIHIYGSGGSGGLGCNGGNGGHALEIINSANIIIDSCFINGGDGGPPDFTFEYGDGGYGLYSDSCSNVIIINSTLQGGTGNYGGHGLGAYNHSDIDARTSQLYGGLGNIQGLPYYSDSTSGVLVGIKSSEDHKLKNFILYPNFPNPFNPSTVISYRLPQNGFVELKIFNVLGQKVKTLISNYQTAGFHSINWDGLDDNNKQVTSGVYIYMLKTASGNKTNKMILVK